MAAPGPRPCPSPSRILSTGDVLSLLVDTLYLPTLILPQTLLLPHMSLPYPLDEGEETQAVDHAIRADRLILVLATTDQSDDGDDDEDDPADQPRESSGPPLESSSYGLAG